MGLCLFPQAGPKFSCATTHGIRVTASALFVPEIGGYAYSIRLALLSPGEEGYLTPEQRGFETAQLRARHWILRAADGAEDHVHGEGVVGRYPLLREGGWREDTQVSPTSVVEGNEHRGIFIYQSKTGAGKTVSFEGELLFVPGSLEEPTGDEFKVAVAQFPLTCGADEYLF
jgi:F-box protein 3